MRDRRVGLAALAAAVLCAVVRAAPQNPTAVGLPPAGQAPAATPAVPLKTGAGVILGRIVEAGSTSGVPGAIAALSSPALGQPDQAFTNGVPGGLRRVVADSQGQFVFRDLPAGTYTIASTATGYVNGAYGQNRIITILRSLDLIRTLEINETDRLLQVSIPMFRRGGISGRVVDEAGEPMVGVNVTVLARMTDWSGPVTQLAHNALTDDRGMYHVDVVPGDYLTGVLAATTTVPVAAVDGFVQALAEGGAAQQAYLSQTLSLGGVLPRGYGTRVGSHVVSQFGTRNAPVVPPMPADGSSWFYPTTYHPSSLSSVSAALINVAPGEEKSGIDILIRPVPARRISGRIAGPAGPAVGIGLQLISSDPTVQRTSPATLIDVPRAVADTAGAFTFIGVASGTYTLYAIKRASAADQTTLWAAREIAVGDSDLKDVEVLLQPGARISGRVVFEGATPPPPANAFRGFILARGVPGSIAALTSLPAAAVDPDGRFTTQPLVPGPYQMSMNGMPVGWTLKTIIAGGRNAADKTFELSPSGITDMVVTFTDKRSTLTGFVRTSDGDPGTVATVVVFPTDRSLWRLPGMPSRRVQTAGPQRDGRYSFFGLPDGEYYVVAADWPTADFSDGQVLTKVMPQASRVTIADGQTLTQDLRMVVLK